MIPLPFLSGLPWRFVAIGAMLLASFVSGWQVCAWRVGKDIAEMRAEAANQFAEASKNVREAEIAEVKINNKIQTEATNETKTINDLRIANARLTDRLRNAAGWPSSSCPAETRTADLADHTSNGAETGGLLSIRVDEVERVDTLTAEAETINAAYRACKAKEISRQN